MRILFTTQPAYGHFHPLLPLAAAARDAGHDIIFASSALFGPVIQAAGYRSVPAGLDWLLTDKTTMPAELKAAPDSTLEVFFAQQFVTATAERLARDVIAGAPAWRPDVIVRERTEFGGAIAGDVLGIPVATVQVASPSLLTPMMLAAMEGPYNRVRLALGLVPDEGLDALDAQPVFCFAPPSLHDPTVPLPRNLMSFRPATHDGADTAKLPAWAEPLGRERPLVYATLGTVFNNPSYELPFFPAVLEGLREQDLDLVITVGPNVDPAYLGPQPASVHVERYMPQSLLFPQCSVIVFHGGYGTLLAAIEHAVPVIVVPFGADQPINARTVERLGIGRVIEEEALTADRMREAVASLLAEPTWKSRMQAVRDETAALPTAMDAVGRLERLA